MRPENWRRTTPHRQVVLAAFRHSSPDGKGRIWNSAIRRRHIPRVAGHWDGQKKAVNSRDTRQTRGLLFVCSLLLVQEAVSRLIERSVDRSMRKLQGATNTERALGVTMEPKAFSLFLFFAIKEPQMLI
jgi:hypothetical protein